VTARRGPRRPAPIPPDAHVVVDGMNVIGSTPDGWWRDRPGATRRLLARLQRLAADTGQPVTLVLDGPAEPDLPEGGHDGVDVVYAARRGRNAGDDRLVELLATLASSPPVCAITSDRELAERARELGAAVHGTAALRAALDRLDDRAEPAD
jgi:YacP-like NYN domain